MEPELTEVTLESEPSSSALVLPQVPLVEKCQLRQQAAHLLISNPAALGRPLLPFKSLP